MLAYDSGAIGLQDVIYIRIEGYGLVKTTAGRFDIQRSFISRNPSICEEEDGTWSLGKVMDKKMVGKLVDQCFQAFGNEKNCRTIGSH